MGDVLRLPDGTTGHDLSVGHRPLTRRVEGEVELGLVLVHDEGRDHRDHLTHAREVGDGGVALQGAGLVAMYGLRRESGPRRLGELALSHRRGRGETGHHVGRDAELLTGEYPPVRSSDRDGSRLLGLGDGSPVRRFDVLPGDVRDRLELDETFRLDGRVVRILGEDVGIENVPTNELGRPDLPDEGHRDGLVLHVRNLGRRVAGQVVDLHHVVVAAQDRVRRPPHRVEAEPVHRALAVEVRHTEETAHFAAGVEARPLRRLLLDGHGEDLVVDLDPRLVDRVRLLCEVGELQLQVLRGDHAGEVEHPLDRSEVLPDRSPHLARELGVVHASGGELLLGPVHGHDRVVKRGRGNPPVLVRQHRIGRDVEGGVVHEPLHLVLSPLLDLGDQ